MVTYPIRERGVCSDYLGSRQEPSRPRRGQVLRITRADISILPQRAWYWELALGRQLCVWVSVYGLGICATEEQEQWQPWRAEPALTADTNPARRAPCPLTAQGTIAAPASSVQLIPTDLTSMSVVNEKWIYYTFVGLGVFYSIYWFTGVSTSSNALLHFYHFVKFNLYLPLLLCFIIFKKFKNLSSILFFFWRGFICGIQHWFITLSLVHGCPSFIYYII